MNSATGVPKEREVVGEKENPKELNEKKTMKVLMYNWSSDIESAEAPEEFELDLTVRPTPFCNEYRQHMLIATAGTAGHILHFYNYYYILDNNVMILAWTFIIGNLIYTFTQLYLSMRKKTD